MRHRVTILLALAALLALAGPAQAADKDCKDFTSHDEAQAYFKANGGSASNNIDRLDADGDGVACEGLPSRSSGSDQPGGSDTPADRGERLADTGSGSVTGTAAAGLLATGLLLVVATRYRGRHAR